MTVYYCMGAFDPKRIKGMDKTIINLTLKMLKKKKESDWTDDEKRLYHDMTEGANYVDKMCIRDRVYDDDDRRTGTFEDGFFGTAESDGNTGRAGNDRSQLWSDH